MLDIIHCSIKTDASLGAI